MKIEQLTVKTKQLDEHGCVIAEPEYTVNMLSEPLDDNLSLDMIQIPAGEFLMGSPETERGRYPFESPQHEVSIAPFSLGRYPITQAQWRIVAGYPRINRDLDPDPSHFKGDLRPVERVSWHDAIEFCDRMQAHTGRPYRLPSEAEWEYACRAGTSTAFYFGKSISPQCANYRSPVTYAGRPTGESPGETTPVDHYGVANAFGLCGMHGNVWEWCQDHWHKSYEDAPTDGSAWLTENDSAPRVWRGGSWNDYPMLCRSAYRDRIIPDYCDDALGFRVALSESEG